MEQWEKNYYISSIAGANNGSSLVVMSKGKYTSKISCSINLCNDKVDDLCGHVYCHARFHL